MASRVHTGPGLRTGTQRLVGTSGSTLVEVLVAMFVLVTGVLAMTQLFLLAAATNESARHTTFAATLAAQKVEELRGLTWGAGADGPQPSPPAALDHNTPGYVDHLDGHGRTVGDGERPPGTAVYLRRWSIVPMDADQALVIRVVVGRPRTGGPPVGQAQGEARLLTLRTRKGP